MTQVAHSQNMLNTIPVAGHFQAVALRAHERGEGSYSLTSKAIAAVDRALRATLDARKAMDAPMTGNEFDDFLMGAEVAEPLFAREGRELTEMRAALSLLVREAY